MGPLHVNKCKLIGQSRQAAQLFLPRPHTAIPAPTPTLLVPVFVILVIRGFNCLLTPLCSDYRVNTPQDSGPVSFFTLNH